MRVYKMSVDCVSNERVVEESVVRLARCNALRRTSRQTEEAQRRKKAKERKIQDES